MKCDACRVRRWSHIVLLLGELLRLCDRCKGGADRVGGSR